MGDYKVFEYGYSSPIGEIDFTIRDERTPWIKSKFRALVQNGDTVAIVRGAIGDNFNCGYSYLLTFPLHGYGPTKIERHMDSRHTHLPFGRPYPEVAAYLYTLTIELRKDY